MPRATRYLVLLAVVMTMALGGSPAARGVEGHTSRPRQDPGAATYSPGGTPLAEIVGLDAAELAERARGAVLRAGSYRFATFALDAVDEGPFRVGEVVIGRGNKTSDPDGSDLEYFDGMTRFSLQEDGRWLVRDDPYDSGRSPLGLFPPMAGPWVLIDLDTIDGRQMYVIARVSQDAPNAQRTSTYWIDAATFLPHKLVSEVTVEGVEPFGNEVIYSDFGAPVDITPPPAALAPTPTPEPLPETSGGRVTIGLRDVYFEPNEVTIPANEDVLIALPNQGAAMHNFVIDEVGVASGDVEWGTSTYVIVNLPAGVYEFRCTIPGHTEVGQVGTLTVRE